jgi:hypothetical protein
MIGTVALADSTCITEYANACKILQEVQFLGVDIDCLIVLQWFLTFFHTPHGVWLP